MNCFYIDDWAICRGCGRQFTGAGWYCKQCEDFNDNYIWNFI